ATENIAISFLPKIKYFHKKNGGVSSALNFGIKHMKGEYFSWLSHDDLYDKNKIQFQINLLKKMPSKDYIIYSNSLIINSKGIKVSKHNSGIKKDLSDGNYMFKQLLSGKNLNGCSLLIPRKVFAEVGMFNEEFKYIQDWDMWIR